MIARNGLIEEGTQNDESFSGFTGDEFEICGRVHFDSDVLH